MITKEKINIYKNYDGDIDGWARAGNKTEKELMTDKDWIIIDDLLQDIFLLKKGRSSSGFNQRTVKKLKEVLPR